MKEISLNMQIEFYIRLVFSYSNTLLLPEAWAGPGPLVALTWSLGWTGAVGWFERCPPPDKSGNNLWKNTCVNFPFLKWLSSRRNIYIQMIISKIITLLYLCLPVIADIYIDMATCLLYIVLTYVILANIRSFLRVTRTTLLLSQRSCGFEPGTINSVPGAAWVTVQWGIL